MQNKREIHKLLEELKIYFDGRDDVVMAFLFGSYASDKMHEDSDLDIAVYFNEDLNEDEESLIWSDLEKLAGINVDFVVLNRAFPSVAENAIKGIPIVIKDRNIFLKFYLRIISEAIDYRTIFRSYRRLKERRAHGF